MLNCENDLNLSIERLYEFPLHHTRLLNPQSYLNTTPLQSTLLSEKATQTANQVPVRLHCKAERVDHRWTDSSLNSLMTKAMTKDIFLSVPGVNTQSSAFTTSNNHPLHLKPERPSSLPF